MRLWSIHPKYLDSKGLVACWREGLLARAVLEGKTRGYRNHPQLDRFKAQEDPLAALDAYLQAVLEEAEARGFHFSREKIGAENPEIQIPVSDAQLRFEFDHLLRKLQVRARSKFDELASIRVPDPHPVFFSVSGEIEEWEKSGVNGSVRAGIDSH